MYDFIEDSYPTEQQQSAIKSLEVLEPKLEKHTIGSTEYLTAVAELSKVATELARTHRCWNEDRVNIDDDEYEFYLAEGAKAPVVPEDEWTQAETAIYIFFTYFKHANLEDPKQETLAQVMEFAENIKTVKEQIYVLKIWHPDYNSEDGRIRTYT